LSVRLQTLHFGSVGVQRSSGFFHTCHPPCSGSTHTGVAPQPQPVNGQAAPAAGSREAVHRPDSGRRQTRVAACPSPSASL
jgi:hypothetical protein